MIFGAEQAGPFKSQGKFAPVDAVELSVSLETYRGDGGVNALTIDWYGTWVMWW